MQANKWIKNYFEDLIILKLIHKPKVIADKLKFAITNGRMVLFEDIGEEIDSILEPIIDRMQYLN